MPFLDGSGSETARGILALVLVGVSLAATGLAVPGCGRQEATSPAAPRARPAASAPRPAPSRAPVPARVPEPGATQAPPSAAAPAPTPAPAPSATPPPKALSAGGLLAAARAARAVAAARPARAPGAPSVVASVDEPAPAPPEPAALPQVPAPPYPYSTPAWKLALARSLDEKPITLEVGADASLEKVLEWLALESGVPIRVHPRAAPTVAGARVGRIRARSLPLKNVLALALASGAPSLRACLEDGAVVIALRDHRPELSDGECAESELFATGDLEIVLDLDIGRAKPTVRQSVERLQALHRELVESLLARPIDDAEPLEGPAHAVLERLGRRANARLILAEPLWRRSAGRVVPPFRAATLGEALAHLAPLLGTERAVAWDDTVFGELQALLGGTSGRSLAGPVIRLR